MVFQKGRQGGSKKKWDKRAARLGKGSAVAGCNEGETGDAARLQGGEGAESVEDGGAVRDGLLGSGLKGGEGSRDVSKGEAIRQGFTLTESDGEGAGKRIASADRVDRVNRWRMHFV